MNPGSAWIGYVAFRFMRRGERHSPSNILSILGIMTGVMALIVIISVMNGFQLGFIESIVEVSSYHIRIEEVRDDKTAAELAASILALPAVRAALPFREIQTLVRGRRDDPQVAVIRGIPANARDLDPGMAEKLDFYAGEFDLSGPGAVILGSELAFRLSVRAGDRISLISVNADGLAGRLAAGAAGPVDSLFTVTGLFETGYYEYDLSWGFASLESARALPGGEGPCSLGIKLVSRWQDSRVLAEIRALPLYQDLVARGLAGEARPWRDYNRSFFGALRTEKLLMFILVGLIFIVAGLNIYQAQRRQVMERRDMIGLLRAVGGGERALRLVFVWDGLAIGLAGAGGGLVLGLLIASHIGAFFAGLESAVNGVIGLINSLAAFAGIYSPAGDFAIFSPAIFYIKEIPSRIIGSEAALIFFFGLVSAVAAAWFASARVARTLPAEVLRDE